MYTGSVTEKPMPEPRIVRLLHEGVSMLWDDGHYSLYPHRFLRGNCPCAHCVQELTGKRVIGILDVPETVRALDWMTVGRYALQFLWSDIHDTGFYPFWLLRTLCPCPECDPNVSD